MRENERRKEGENGDQAGIINRKRTKRRVLLKARSKEKKKTEEKVTI